MYLTRLLYCRAKLVHCVVRRLQYGPRRWTAHKRNRVNFFLLISGRIFEFNFYETDLQNVHLDLLCVFTENRSPGWINFSSSRDF